MTEPEWLASDDPFALLGYLGERADFRKRQLLCLAVWGEARHLLSDEGSRQALARLERSTEHDWTDQDDKRHDEFFEAFTDLDNGALVNRLWDRITAGDEQLWAAVEAGTDASLSSWDEGCVEAAAAFTVVA